MRARTARRPIWLLAGLVIAFSTSPAGAEERANNALQTGAHSAAECPAGEGGPIADCLPCAPCAADCRRPGYCRVIPYAWIPGFEGDLTVRGRTAPVDVSVGKTADVLFSNLNFVGLGQIEA